jgi:hypothetical protein
MATQIDDITFGEASEQNIQNQLQQFLAEPLQRQGGYSLMDFCNEGKTVWVELKTRRIRHNQYPTAIIGRNKINFCSDPEKKYYFVYAYTDGLFYIKYDKELFDTFEVGDFQRGNRPDCYNGPSTVVHIPYSHLTPLI